MSDATPHIHRPVEADKPWRVVRYGLRHTSAIRAFRRHWTARLYRRICFFAVADSYGVEPNYDWGGEATVAEWLTEVLHVVWAFEMREHERYVLVPAHASRALDRVPAEILRAARIDRSRPL